MSIYINEEYVTQSNRKYLESFYEFSVAALREGLNQPEVSRAPYIEFIANTFNGLTEAEGLQKTAYNLPPRHFKSTMGSILYPAWLMARDPTCFIIGVSYSQMLAECLGAECLNLVRSSWYKELFPHVKIRNDTRSRRYFRTTLGGGRLATSINGTLTGMGGQVIIMDDPQNAGNIHNHKYREKVREWCQTTCMSRINVRNKGKIILLSQRLHEHDLTGCLLETGFTQISLSLQAESDEKIEAYGYKFERKEGELLLPCRMNEDDIKELKLSVGSEVYSCQYQQKPMSSEGSMIRADWIKSGRELSEEEIEQAIKIQSWDTAVKTGENSDYSVGTTWLILDNCYYLWDAVRVRLEYPYLREKIESYYNIFKPDKVLIEDRSSGGSLIQELKEKTCVPVIGINPKGDKVTRVAKASSYFEAGIVRVRPNIRHMKEILSELLAFPNGKHDDAVDSITQFINYAKIKYCKTARKARSSENFVLAT